MRAVWKSAAIPHHRRRVTITTTITTTIDLGDEVWYNLSEKEVSL